MHVWIYLPYKFSDSVLRTEILACACNSYALLKTILHVFIYSLDC